MAAGEGGIRGDAGEGGQGGAGEQEHARRPLRPTRCKRTTRSKLASTRKRGKETSNQTLRPRRHGDRAGGPRQRDMPDITRANEARVPRPTARFALKICTGVLVFPTTFGS